ncbi:TetR family transcriptional regulator [Tamaricihabitans halophyticus]|uniref:TetR family transcriptional regulator n=1 Tax=Tamaricihabitans halophyticus TaxID=1262583 RepID=A0A4V2ST40_9PSEU|nr:TetR/AcrR family transcriptional regulator [Tamaricihabitans halophyticus]TCP49336.1 TetR family transcriptional regulator [Tamaricihabitans halophyticus]
MNSSAPADPPLRAYHGLAGDQRQARRRAQLLEAGLDLLAAEGGEANLTVRGVCKRAGLAARYFYESFADRTVLASAVYDEVVTDLAARTQRAVAAAPAEAHARVRAGLDVLIRTIAEDPRRGQLLFAVAPGSAVLAARRIESADWFAALLRGHARDFYGIGDSTALRVNAQFLVGGLAQTLTAWLRGELDVDRSHLVDRCAEIFLAFEGPVD